MTFKQFLELDEGMWLPDKNAVPGMSRINPFPATHARLKRIMPKPVKPPKLFPPTVRPVGSLPRPSFPMKPVKPPPRLD
jgi:hypothetical protein